MSFFQALSHALFGSPQHECGDIGDQLFPDLAKVRMQLRAREVVLQEKIRQAGEYLLGIHQNIQFRMQQKLQQAENRRAADAIVAEAKDELKTAIASCEVMYGNAATHNACRDYQIPTRFSS